jgi:hypothetical protein
MDEIQQLSKSRRQDKDEKTNKNEVLLKQIEIYQSRLVTNTNEIFHMTEQLASARAKTQAATEAETLCMAEVRIVCKVFCFILCVFFNYLDNLINQLLII